MLKKDQYLKTVRRPYRPFFISLFYAGQGDPKNFQGLIQKKFFLQDTVIYKGIWHHDKEKLLIGGRLAFDEWQDPKKLELAKKELARREKQLIEATKKGLRDYCRAFEEYTPAIILAWTTEIPLVKKLRRLLSKELMEQLSIPEQDNFYKQEEFDLVNAKDLKKHVKKYEWINSRYGEINPYTVAQAKERLAKIDKRKFLEERKKQKTRVQTAIKKAKLNLGQKHEVLVDMIQYLVYYRTQRTDIINKSIYLFVPRLKRIAKEKGLSYKQLIHCTKDEILNNNLPSINEINHRITDHAMINENGKIYCVSGKQAAKIGEFFKENVSQVREFKGEIASKGKVRGQVKLVFDNDDFSKVKTGDILVTSMTTPPMVLIMKKASAFVTDEGGITSHAAIISREMKKPCIIGTKIATKVFKDGDLVEVDAKKGVVRRITK